MTMISSIDDLNYPEKTVTYYIVNAPYIFAACWKVCPAILALGVKYLLLCFSKLLNSALQIPGKVICFLKSSSDCFHSLYAINRLLSHFSRRGQERK